MNSKSPEPLSNANDQSPRPERLPEPVRPDGSSDSKVGKVGTKEVVVIDVGSDQGPTRSESKIPDLPDDWRNLPA